MTHEDLVLLIAECLIEPHFPDDPMKEAENIATRIEKRLKITEEIKKTSNRSKIPCINGLNE